MSDSSPTTPQASDEIDKLLKSETGSRSLDGPFGKLVLTLLISWSLFQLWYASPLPYMFNLQCLMRTRLSLFICLSQYF